MGEPETDQTTGTARPDYSRLFRLDGRRAVVVGAGSGIGRESALALAAHGADVVCADRNLEAAEETAALGAGTEVYELDVTDADAVARAAAELGDVDVLVFTAATNVRKRVLDYTAEEFDRVVGLNLRSSFELVRAFGAGMAERGRGSIVGFSSIRAVTVEPGQGVYAATKAGLVQLLRAAAVELGEQGVRVNAVAPGIVDTPLTAQIRAVPEWSQAYASKSALGRWSRPDELVGRGRLSRLGRVVLRHREPALRRRRVDRHRRAVHAADVMCSCEWVGCGRVRHGGVWTTRTDCHRSQPCSTHALRGTPAGLGPTTDHRPRRLRGGGRPHRAGAVAVRRRHLPAALPPQPPPAPADLSAGRPAAPGRG